MPALCNRNDVVNAGGKRVREFQPEIDRIAADAADLLRRVDLALVGFKLTPLRSAVVGTAVRARSGLGHGVTPFRETHACVQRAFGHEKSTLFRVLRVYSVSSHGHVGHLISNSLQKHFKFTLLTAVCD